MNCVVPEVKTRTTKKIAKAKEEKKIESLWKQSNLADTGRIFSFPRTNAIYTHLTTIFYCFLFP